ncbi:hypothetical protein SLS64_003854 [Diaporthe eres]
MPACNRCLSLGIYCSTTTTSASTTSTSTPSMGYLLQPGSVFPLVPPSTDAISPPPTHADPFGVLPVLSHQQGNHLSPSPAFTTDAVDWGNHDIFSPQARDDSESALVVSAANANGESRPLSAISCGTRLSHLRMQLSLHLQQCLEDSAGFWDSDTDANAKALHQHHHQQRQPAVRNPFGEALCYTAELLSIIRSFMQQQVFGDASLSPSPSSSVSGTIDLVTMLDILSAHTQMVSIYDELFQRLYARLRTTAGPDGRGSSGSSPSSSSSAPTAQSQPQFQALPGLQLAGFPVLQGTLQIKILMQAIMHQFETLEKELSLPAELRVSKRTDTYPGGLIGRDPRTRHVVNSFFASSLQNSTEHVTSLRTTIDQLSRVLDL